ARDEGPCAADQAAAPALRACAPVVRSRTAPARACRGGRGHRRQLPRRPLAMRGQHPSAGATRIVLLAACCALVAAVNAAGLGGTFSTQGAQGKVVARLEVRGERLVGYIDFAGRTRVNLVGAIQGSSARGSATSKEGIGEF